MLLPDQIAKTKLKLKRAWYRLLSVNHVVVSIFIINAIHVNNAMKLRYAIKMLNVKGSQTHPPALYSNGFMLSHVCRVMQ